MKWIINNWHHALPFLAIFSLIFIFMFVSKEDTAVFLIWLLLPVYFLHEFEEYVYPSGWMNLMNKRFTGKEEPILPYLEWCSFLTNIPFVWGGITLSAILATYIDIAFGLYAVFFVLFAIFPHLGLIRKQGYNPGLIASLILNLPVGGFALYYLVSRDLVSGADLVIGAIAGFLGLLIPVGYTMKTTPGKVDSK